MSNDGKSIVLYGDESHSNEIVTYGFLIIPQQNIAAVELAVEETKKRYGLCTDTRIHCREIFSGDARKKTNFAEFSIEKMFSFLSEIMVFSFLAGARGWVGYLNKKASPDALLFEAPGTEPIRNWNISNLKIQMLFCYQAAVAPLTHIFPPQRVKAYVDGDKTNVRNIDTKDRKIDMLRSFFPVEHNNTKIFPEPVHGEKPLLLDLADLLAYAAARGLSETSIKNKNHFISIVNALDPGYSEVIFDDPSSGGAMFSIRSYDPSDRVKTYINSFIDS